MYKILMTYKSVEGLDTLIKNQNFKLDINPKPDIETLKKLIVDVDAILIRSEVKITSEIISMAKNLRLIARAGTGVDNVDVKAASEKGVAVINVPGGNTIAAAEHTMALILAAARNVPEAHASLKEHKWEREKYTGFELCGKTIGLVGFGRIAREVSVRSKSFGMNVVSYDPYISSEFAKSLGVDMVDTFENLLKLSDIISIHIPLSDSTKNLINKESISKMKDGVLIINTARGPIVNSKDLAEALSDGKVRAAIDVFPEEPPKEFALIDAKNIVVTPHLGASTEEAQIKIAKEVSECIVDFFEKGIIRNAVNMPTIDIETFKNIKPYLELAEKMGRFHSQISDGAPKELNITYSGEINELPTHLLTLSYLKGVFISIVEGPINYINAPLIAKNRGISVNEKRTSKSEDFSSLLTVSLMTETEENEVSGTIFSHKMPRIVRINGLPLDVYPAGCMLFLLNVDKPGIIGKVGTLLGENKINIAGMDVARVSAGTDAFTLINVDACPSGGILEQIKEIDGVKKVKYIEI